MAFLLNGKVLKPDHPFVDAKGNQYPAGWLRHHTLAEKEAIGIVEIPNYCECNQPLHHH
jgi:hypothetical protein